MTLFIIIFLHLSNVFCDPGGKHKLVGGGCPLPKQPDNGFYDVSDCEEGDFSSKCRKVPGIIVSQYVVLTYQCNPGYILPEYIKHTLCNDGTWDPEPPQCLKLCKELSSNSLDLKCVYRGSNVDCGQPMRPGTELRAQCKDTYHVSDPSTSFTTTECLPDGDWGNELYKCVPVCGIRNVIQITPTIKGDPLRDQYEFPWLAGVYRTEGQDIVYICGGTIIHPKAILTVAQCVYNDVTKSKVDEKTVQVAVGKYRSNWNHKDDSKTEQKFRVVQIITEDKYAGESNKYEHDIAILVLDKFIVLNAAAMPICFDKDEQLSLYKGSNAVGFTMSWGTTENGDKSDVLVVTRFQVMDFQDCLKKYKPSQYISYDKLCAALTKDNRLHRGGNGNGLTFPRFTYGVEQHFIYGIFSLREDNGIVPFTNVTTHMKWIHKVLNEIVQSK